MANEIQLISDGEGLAVIGDAKAVDAFIGGLPLVAPRPGIVANPTCPG